MDQKTEGHLQAMAAALGASAGQPLCLRFEINGDPEGVRFVDTANGTALAKAEPGRKLDGLLRLDAGIAARLAQRSLTFREALRSQAVVFAGDLSILPALERAFAQTVS
ncbi:MAG TPA: hypothetical protein VH208_09120 [Myxococcaceae bacterium]|jgi:hypothetical protein|nr:hypothetical protein [Myxococcaceae bacterium]